MRMDQGTAEKTSLGRRLIIKRPRLTALLDRAEARTIVFLAPAGYGKTTLAREWLDHPTRRGVWIRATPSSSDVAAFAVSLANAASKVTGRPTDQLLQWLRTTRDPSRDVETLSQLIRGIASTWPPSVWLVIDDYQFLAGSNAAEDLADAVAQESNVRVVVTTRVRPKWATVRRVLYGEIFEIGQNLLSMTPDEAGAVLGADRRSREVPGLVALAGGWPAVIGLAALSEGLPVSPDVVPEALHSFFAEELFRDLPQATRSHLPKLALAPDISVGAARALCGDQASVILTLAAQAGFIAEIDETLELHPLLRQFLKRKLVDLERGDVFQAAERLGQWYIDQRNWDEAFAVGIEIESPRLLGETIDAALDNLLSAGRLSTLHEWIAAAREHGVRPDALDLAATEIAFREGRWSEAETRAMQVARRLGSDPRISRLYRLAGQSAHLRDRPDDALRSLDLARRTASCASDLRDALWNKFLVLGELEDMEAARRTLAEFEENRGDDIEAAVRASQARLHLAARLGSVAATVDMEAGTVELLNDVRDPVVVTGFLQTWTTALCLVGRYETALDAAQRELSVARATRLDFVIPHALAACSLAFLGLRDFQQASASARDGTRLAEQGQDLHAEMNLAVIRARIELAQGRPVYALEQLQERWSRKPSPGMYADFLAIRALALACTDDPKEADRYIQLAEGASIHVDGRVTRAFAKAIVGTRLTRSDARESVLTAIQTTNEAGTLDGFVCAYRAHPPLLQRIAELGDPSATRLLVMAQRIDPGLTRRLGMGGGRQPLTSGTLSPREQEVLELVRKGLSNKEIARILWITESTAKVHVRHILEKLGVRTRTEAALFPIDDR
jgi:ATP/maltotriose-dependent transcriptional regulator MalT